MHAAIAAIAQLTDADKTELARLVTVWPPFDREPEHANLIELELLERSVDPEDDRLVLTPLGSFVAGALLVKYEIPRLAHGTLDGARVRLWGDEDGSAAQLSGRADHRLWRVHEIVSNLPPVFVLQRALPNDADLERAAAVLGITLEPPKESPCSP